ncbi:Hypothetical predicted protein [Olea europaea subsp. europaea]|uniref:CCHC-type domain-containing protein n=1 Tax=Olea europaea subsp. europaea TaxID=158383 RepID=A0A8S0U5B3_OLEEU|nr:Hypothetical predicted protein [Olea europaea subsp. europaea]
MAGKNSGVCHSCRGRGHFFVECPIKVRCPLCKHGYQKCFEVEKKTCNKRRLFKCCSEKCGFWDWYEEGQARGECSSISATSTNPAVMEAVEDMTRTFQSQVRLNDDEELHISVNVTIRKEKSGATGNAKGKGLG